MKDNLTQLVFEEVENIKRFANPTQLKRLNIKYFDPTRRDFCIYGKLTGDCFSQSALKLKNKCTKPYSNALSEYVETEYDMFKQYIMYSPLEYYITSNFDMGIEIIKYIKGELEINPLQLK